MAWPCDSRAYDLVSRIGRGAFSTVWHALPTQACSSTTANPSLPAAPHPVAIKIIDLDNVLSSFEDILQEVQTLRLSKHDNVLSFHCSFVQANQLWLVTQLMDLGSCLRVMNISKNKGFGEGMNEDWLAYILRESLQGLAYLHSNGQIHRDMKAGNILLDSRGGVRLADFGVSGWTFAGGQRQEKVNTFVGTPCYMAPEVMEQAGGYDNRADIWSLGITALELAKGKAPYAHMSPMRVLVVTIEEEPPNLKSYSSESQRTGAPFSSAFDEFYKKCLQKNPKLRPPANELLKHKFLQGRTAEALVNQLLAHVGVVGEAGDDKALAEGKLPGEGSILLEKVDDVDSADSSFSDIRGGLFIDNSGENSPVAGVKHAAFSRTSTGASTAPSEGYVAGTTWVFDRDDSGSPRELRRSIGSSSGSTRTASLRFSSISTRRTSGGGGGEGGSSNNSNSTSSGVNKAILSPSMDDFLSDFEREASSLPSVPVPIIPISILVPTKKLTEDPPPDDPEGTGDSGLSGFIDDLADMGINSTEKF